MCIPKMGKLTGLRVVGTATCQFWKKAANQSGESHLFNTTLKWQEAAAR